MRTARWAASPRRVVSRGLVVAVVLGIGACSGPPSYEPSPVDWSDNNNPPPEASQQRGSAGGGSGGGSNSDSGDSDSGDSGDGTSVELCTAVDVATVQQAFEAPEEPTATSAEETAGLQELSVVGGCSYEWSGGDVAGSVTITAGVAESSDDAATFLEGQASTAGLSGDPVDGLGDASLVDTAGSVVADSAVAIGVADGDGTKTVVVLTGPLDADPTAYAEIGSTVLGAIQ